MQLNLDDPKALPRLLLVEDDDIDAMAIERALERNNLEVDFERAVNGRDALTKLRARSGACLIVLDLKMPRMNGLQFLEELRNDESLHRCVVIVLTTSRAESDVDAAYAQHAAGYVVKELETHQLGHFVELVSNYLKTVLLPDPPRK